MTKKAFWLTIAAVWILTVFSFLGVVGAVETALQYQPIYANGGYRNMHQVERDGNGKPLSKYPEKYSISHNGVLSVKYWLLRFYIPPMANGTTNLAIFCTQSGKFGAVARLGAPPQCDLSTYTNSEAITDSTFIGLPWDRCATSLQQLRDRDWRVKNEAGSFDIVADVNSSSEGEWLYVKVLFNGPNIKNVGLVNFSVEVPLTDYVTWYDEVEWDADGNPPQDEKATIGKGSCNFASGAGDPIDASSYIISVTVSGNGSGTVFPGGNPIVKKGGSQSFLFIPNSSHVKSVKYGTADGVLKDEGSVQEYSFSNVQEDMRLEVVFEKGSAPTPTLTEYVIHVETNGQGAVSPAGPYSVEEGEDQTFVFDPDTGWEVTDVWYRHTGDASYTHDEAKDRYTFENVKAEMDLLVEFSEIKSPVYDEYEADETFPTHHIDDIGDGKLVFNPTLDFAYLLDDQVNCYVGYWSQGRLFLAREALDGKVVFELYYRGVEITPETFKDLDYSEWWPFFRYGTHDFDGGTVWACDIFDKVEFEADMVSGEDVIFLIGISAEGKSGPSQGALFTFSP